VSVPISVRRVTRTFGFTTHARQTFAIVWTSFATIAKSATGLVLWAPLAMLLAVLMPVLKQLGGVPLVPRTAEVITFLTAPVAGYPQSFLVLIPLLIVFYAGELVWRERDAGLSEMADATPVPDRVFFLGKFLGLVLVLVVWMALLTMAGVIGQVLMGYFDVEIGLYLRILFGLQLVDYLLFALLVFVVHAVVNQKHIGYLVALIAYGVILFPSWLGIEHHLLIYGSDPGWSYSDIRGFAPFLGPWLWFKLYWAAWALQLAVAARLLWTRGTERTLKSRLRLARLRSTRATVGVAATAMALILMFGGFIFYNTNLLNQYRTAANRDERRAEYERRYGKYAGVAQPALTGTSLRMEIYPERREVEIRGNYVLANTSSAAIDSIHVTTVPEVETGAVSVDRPAALVVTDADLGYRVYALEQPLQPGDSLHLSFDVHAAPHGFGNNGVDALVLENGTYFTNLDCLPAIGYQPRRELHGGRVRKQYGLAPRPAVPSLDDVQARRIRAGGDPQTFDAVVGTSGDQIAVAPGALRRTWTEGLRRYFQYVADVPINNRYAVFSARYAVHEEQWTGPEHAVTIQIFHHPTHDVALGRMVAGVRASLDRYTRWFGPYPHSYLRLIENPTINGAQTEVATVEYGEPFALLNPGDGPQDLDLVFAVVAHGVAREWWGMQVAAADVQGAGLLGQSLETYCAMRVVEDALGPEHLRRYRRSMRVEYAPRAVPPLLRASDSFAYTRRGPFAMYALSRYIGAERVNEALRRLLETHGPGTSPPPTSLDLYQALQTVTPDQFRSLLHDLFEVNAYWELEMERATAQQTGAGTWQVTLDVRARKVVVDEAGVETEVPMDDWIEIGAFGEGEEPYVERHRVHSGTQTITLSVPQKPARAGIDPRDLLSDFGDTDPKIKEVKIGN
jgi:ABC-2 type transport system permease protein